MLLLTEAMVVLAPFTLFEEDLHALGHVYAEEHAGIADNGCPCCEERRFEDGILGEVLLAEGLGSKIPFYDEGAIETAEDADDDVKDYFEEMPGAVVADLEHDELTRSEGIHGC